LTARASDATLTAMASRRTRAGAVIASLFALASGCATNNDITRAPERVMAPRAASVPPPLASGRLPGTAKPVRYDVSLVIDPAQERFTGDVTITIDVPRATSAVVLHGRELTILRAEASQNGAHIPATADVRLAAGGEAPDELVFVLAKPLAVGRAELRVAYSAPISNKLSGLYRVREDNLYYAFTQFEPTDARRMLPCFDEPSFKAPFELRVTTPKGNLVVANTNELDRHEIDDGRSVVFHFAPSPPLPTYLFALAVGPLDVREGAKEPVPIRVITTKGKAKLGDLALDAAAADVKLLGDYFARPYPYAKLDLLAVPEFGYGAMENAGLISFREDLVLLDPKTAATEARRAMAINVAHEISHHWFGNLVTMPWWDDLWLNEGFATWMESKLVDTWRPQMGARAEALRARMVAMNVDALESARAVRQPVSNSAEAEEAFDGLTYDKGAAVLGMLEAWLGEAPFRDGVRSYLKAHEFGTATAADLFGALAASSNKDVWSVARTFLDAPGVPVVRAELACEKGRDARVTLTQRRYRARAAGDAAREQPEPSTPWKIPLCVAFEGSKTPACGMLDGPSGEISLGTRRCPAWVYPNAHEAGYFRVALSPTLLAAAAHARAELDVRARIGLVNDAWALVQSGDLPSDALLDLLWSLRGERSRLVVEQVIYVLQRVDDELVDPSQRPVFRAFASAILGPIAREVGWEPRPRESDETKLLRKSVLAAFATLTEDPAIAAQADRIAASYLKDPRSVDADIAAIALRASTRRAGDKRFTELVEAARRAPTPEDRLVTITALGSFADPALLRRALDPMLGDQLKVQDGFAIFGAAMEYPESRPVVLAWLKDHFAELKAKAPSFVLTRLASAVETICDADARADADAFFTAGLKGTEIGDRGLRQALEAASLCIDLRRRESARTEKRLAKKP
jgi:aminopeptidase N